MNKGFSIAIDGPVASGKGTTARALASILDGIFIDTGAMYRAATLYCLKNNIDINNRAQVEQTLPVINIGFEKGRISLNGEDVTDQIRDPKVSSATAIIATYPGVREEMVKMQRIIAENVLNENKAVIMEGRDIGTVVLPQADLKIFLDADLEVRAKRRFEQHQAQGLPNSLEQILAETKERDEIDQNRETDPLPKEPEKLGYFVIDNSSQTEEETARAITQELEKRGLING